MVELLLETRELYRRERTPCDAVDDTSYVFINCGDANFLISETNRRRDIDDVIALDLSSSSFNTTISTCVADIEDR